MPIKHTSRNRNRRARLKPGFRSSGQAKRNRLSKLFLLIAGGLATIIALIIVVVPTKYWDGKTRLALAIHNQDDSVSVSAFDPQANSITTLLVPQNVEVDVARQLGMWRMGSVWQLGKNEKVGGKLVSETITKALGLPTEGWAEKQGQGFAEGGVLAIWKSVVTPYKTNLNLKDRIRLAMFAQGVKNSGRTEIDLTKTTLLSAAKLADGSQGYKVRSSANAQIQVLFADSNISQENLDVSVFHPNSGSLTAEKVGKIVQVLGAKVTRLEEVEDADFDCLVVGKETATRKKIAAVFDCSQKEGGGEGAVELRIGHNFIKRF